MSKECEVTDGQKLYHAQTKMNRKIKRRLSDKMYVNLDTNIHSEIFFSETMANNYFIMIQPKNKALYFHLMDA